MRILWPSCAFIRTPSVQLAASAFKLALLSYLILLRTIAGQDKTWRALQALADSIPEGKSSLLGLSAFDCGSAPSGFAAIRTTMDPKGKLCLNRDFETKASGQSRCQVVVSIDDKQRKSLYRRLNRRPTSSRRRPGLGTK